MELKELIESAWLDRELLKKEEVKSGIRQVIELLDKGKVRVSVSLFGRPTSVELDYLQLKGH